MNPRPYAAEKKRRETREFKADSGARLKRGGTGLQRGNP
jgi:hypothetical protein